jgi:pimeloyl-ACP methyl ester carboxylesterase
MLRSSAVVVAILTTALPISAGERRFDVGGFRLNLRCEGTGAPVVVLDAGAGDTLSSWDWVVPDLKKTTRVCAYDRAGLGRSDPGPRPRNSERIVTELHELLTRARVPPPYVLVGHSFGGLNVRLYAARHPDRVSGVVLVDATPEDFPAIEESLRTAAEREKLRTMRAAAPQAFADELDGMAESAAAVRAAPFPPQLPVVILSAAHRDDSEAFRSAWAALQRRMAGSFANARQISAERSDHYIQFDEPELIVQAVKEMVAAARARLSPDRRGSSGSP